MPRRSFTSLPPTASLGMFEEERQLFTFSPAANLCALSPRHFLPLTIDPGPVLGEGVALILCHEIAEESSGAGLEGGSGNHSCRFSRISCGASGPNTK